MITGEERIRELLGELYGYVTNYDGRPTDDQVARTDALGHELEDVLRDFQRLTDRELPTLNSGLKGKKLEPITVLSETDWQKAHEEGSPSAASAKPGTGERFERD